MRDCWLAIGSVAAVVSFRSISLSSVRLVRIILKIYDTYSTNT